MDQFAPRIIVPKERIDIDNLALVRYLSVNDYPIAHFPYGTATLMPLHSQVSAYKKHKLIQPGGQTLGIDGSDQRLDYAREHFSAEGIQYVCKSFLQPLNSPIADLLA